MANIPVEVNAARLKVSVACRIDKGTTRVINEDACIICDLGEPMVNAVTARE